MPWNSVLPCNLCSRHSGALLPWTLALALPPLTVVLAAGPAWTLAGVMFWPFPAAMLVYQTGCLLDGRRAGLGEAVRAVARRAAVLVLGGPLAAGLVAAPGMADSALVSLPLRLLLVGLLLRLAFVPQVILLEQRGAAASVVEAWRVGRGRFGAVTLLAILHGSLYLLAAWALGRWGHPMAPPLLLLVSAFAMGGFLVGATALFRGAAPVHGNAHVAGEAEGWDHGVACPDNIPPSPPSNEEVLQGLAVPASLEEFGDFDAAGAGEPPRCP